MWEGIRTHKYRLELHLKVDPSLPINNKRVSTANAHAKADILQKSPIKAVELHNPDMFVLCDSE